MHSAVGFKRRGHVWRYVRAARMLLGIVIALTVSAAPRQAAAMPMFARKYNLPCERCHTMVPRLNNFGYNFYRAGYRLPSNEIKPISAANAISFFGQISATNTNPAGDSGFTVDGVEIDLATAVEKQYAVRGVYQFDTGGGSATGFNELWAQYNSSPKGPFFAVRAGQIPILSGFQLLGNRNITQTGPMMFDGNGPLSGPGQGNFSPGDVEQGLQATYGNGGFFGSVSLLNGIDEAGDGGVTLSGRRGHDVMGQAEYLIGHAGTAVGAFYYIGKTPITSMSFNDNFRRAGVFGTYGRNFKTRGDKGIDIRAELNGGLLFGQDATDRFGHHDSSYGSLAEVDVYLRSKTAIVARFDNERASNAPGVPTTEAYTFAVAHRLNDLMRVELEYRTQNRPGANSVIGAVWFFY